MKLLVALSCAPSFASLRETNTFPARLLKRVPHKSSDTVATVKLMNEGGGHARLCVSVWVCVCDGVCVFECGCMGRGWIYVCVCVCVCVAYSLLPSVSDRGKAGHSVLPSPASTS